MSEGEDEEGKLFKDIVGIHVKVILNVGGSHKPTHLKKVERDRGCYMVGLY